MEEINSTPKALGRYYKGGEAISKNHLAITNESQKNSLKDFFKTQKMRKWGKHCEES